MTSGNIFPRRFTKIDDLNRHDHSYLDNSDICYFLGEYTARKGYAYSYTNNLILNFKKTKDKQGKPEWRYKDQAIREAAEAFGIALGKAVDRLTFVPVPPSKASEDPLFDDRLTRMLASIRANPVLDIRELVIQTTSVEAVHASAARPGPAWLEEKYRVDHTLIEPAPESIAIVDDILTTGAHFRAMKSVLSARFPLNQIIGLFLARRVPDTSDF